MKKILILLILGIFCLPLQSMAGDFDASKPLICAVIETFECGPGADCQRGTAESISMPQFLKVNFEEKTISSTPESGSIRTTKIRNLERLDNRLILQGIQNGRAWSMVINVTTGKVTLSASDEQAGFVVFGACTPLD